MAIAEGYKTNHETLIRAFRNGDTALLECTRLRDNATVVLLCALHKEGDEIVMSPFAEMIDGNPYELYRPPLKDETEGEQHEQDMIDAANNYASM